MGVSGPGVTSPLDGFGMDEACEVSLVSIQAGSGMPRGMSAFPGPGFCGSEPWPVPLRGQGGVVVSPMRVNERESP